MGLWMMERQDVPEKMGECVQLLVSAPSFTHAWMLAQETQPGEWSAVEVDATPLTDTPVVLWRRRGSNDLLGWQRRAVGLLNTAEPDRGDLHFAADWRKRRDALVGEAQDGSSGS